ncbi:MAG: hypothetical protein ACI8PT_001770 [Gammaproteobacteria bacterium]|jgi:hypothetical protein
MKRTQNVPTDSTPALAIIIGIIVAAACLRLLPHPPNFAPIVGMALFAGAILADRRWALLVPLLAMIASDAILGFHAQMWIVYLALGLCVGVGTLLRNRIGLTTVALGTLGASITFFVVTNLGVWAASGLYPMTPEGLVACFVAAIPFFQNALAGDLTFAALLFGGHAALTRFAPKLSANPA